MKTYLITGIVALIILAAGYGRIRAQDARIGAQEKIIAEQGESLGLLFAANAAQAAAITELRAAKKRDDALVLETLSYQDALTTKVAALEGRLREALRHDATFTFDSVLPAAAADALCLQWHAASGRLPADHSGNAPGGVVAGTSHPAAAGGGDGSDCRGWRKVTVRDAVEWNGLLLRHAGLERLDKAALREWAFREVL